MKSLWPGHTQTACFWVPLQGGLSQQRLWSQYMYTVHFWRETLSNQSPHGWLWTVQRPEALAPWIKDSNVCLPGVLLPTTFCGFRMVLRSWSWIMARMLEDGQSAPLLLTWMDELMCASQIITYSNHSTFNARSFKWMTSLSVLPHAALSASNTKWSLLTVGVSCWNFEIYDITISQYDMLQLQRPAWTLQHEQNVGCIGVVICEVFLKSLGPQLHQTEC